MALESRVQASYVQLTHLTVRTLIPVRTYALTPTVMHYFTEGCKTSHVFCEIYEHSWFSNSYTQNYKTVVLSDKMPCILQTVELEKLA